MYVYIFFLKTKNKNIRYVHSDASYSPSVSAGDYQTQLFDQQGDEYLPANRDLRMFVMVKDPDDEVGPEYNNMFSWAENKKIKNMC